MSIKYCIVLRTTVSIVATVPLFFFLIYHQARKLYLFISYQPARGVSSNEKLTFLSIQTRTHSNDEY